jgi:tetratricopeptide (TPR) repeat protein
LRNYEEALGLFRQVGSRLGEANTLKAIADVQQFLDQRQEAWRNYEEALGLYRQVGSRIGEANTLKAIADVQQFLKQSQEALRNYEEALGLFRQVGDRLGEANVFCELGGLESDPQQAMNHFRKAQDIYIQIGDQYSQGRNLLWYIIPLQRQQEDSEGVKRSLDLAMAIAEAINYEPFRQRANKIRAEIDA